MTGSEKVRALAADLYGPENASGVAPRIEALLAAYRQRIPLAAARDLDQRDALLITYPDQVVSNDRPPLQELAEFADRYLKNVVSGIHLLPFYPWSSDDGFSVIDPRRVAARYGTWDDIRHFCGPFELMFDAVVNHASAESPWFRLFLKDQAPYRDYFIRVEGSPDLSQVARPRTTPLTTAFEVEAGRQAVWTTFGPDQVDFNYKSPNLLIEILDVLLFYAAQGAAFIRLDAVAYLWKEFGTACINLPQTHTVIQLMRAVLEQAAPQVRLITETNVPQPDNLAYFGDGTNEAHLIYNFTLPPLVLHAFAVQRADLLAEWLSSLHVPPGDATFLNMLATHDGIGLNPLRGILSESEINGIADQCLSKGGFVSYKQLGGADTAPYELNMNYLDALGALGPGVDPDLELERFVAAHAIMLSLPGMPGIYFHSLFGSHGWLDSVLSSGQKRRINREKLSRKRLEVELSDPRSWRARVFHRLSRLLRIRATQPAFAPSAPLVAKGSEGAVLAFLRGALELGAPLLCLYNLSPARHEFTLPELGIGGRQPVLARDLIAGSLIDGSTLQSLMLQPYQSLWLTLEIPE